MRRSMLNDMKRLDALMNDGIIKESHKMTFDNEDRMRRTLKEVYGYNFFVGGYAYMGIDDLGKDINRVRINKKDGLYTVTVITFKKR